MYANAMYLFSRQSVLMVLSSDAIRDKVRPYLFLDLNFVVKFNIKGKVGYEMQDLFVGLTQSGMDKLVKEIRQQVKEDVGKKGPIQKERNKGKAKEPSRVRAVQGGNMYDMMMKQQQDSEDEEESDKTESQETEGLIVTGKQIIILPQKDMG